MNRNFFAHNSQTIKKYKWTNNPKPNVPHDKDHLFKSVLMKKRDQKLTNNYLHSLVSTQKKHKICLHNDDILKSNLSISNLMIHHQNKFHEHNFPHIYALHGANQSSEEIHQLLKKLTKNFLSGKNEACFVIATGLFEGAQFHVKTTNQQISLTIKSASLQAKRLVIENRELLQKRLDSHRIILHEIRFY